MSLQPPTASAWSPPSNRTMLAVRAPSSRPTSSVTAAKMASGGPICATSVATRCSAACSSSRDCSSTWRRAFSSARAAAAMTGTTRSRSLTLDGCVHEHRDRAGAALDHAGAVAALGHLQAPAAVVDPDGVGGQPVGDLQLGVAERPAQDDAELLGRAGLVQRNDQVADVHRHGMVAGRPTTRENAGERPAVPAGRSLTGPVLDQRLAAGSSAGWPWLMRGSQRACAAGTSWRRRAATSRPAAAPPGRSSRR